MLELAQPADYPKTLHMRYIALACLLLGVIPAAAQPAAKAGSAAKSGKAGSKPAASEKTKPVVASDPSSLPELKVLSTTAPSYEMTAGQKEALRRALPASYEKLSQRAPLHIVAIGDELVDMAGSAPPAGDVLKGYCGVLACQLADRFFYPGGVRVIAPNRRQPTKSVNSTGTEITLRCIGRTGTTMLHAMQSLTTYGFETKPDLVIISYGREDAAQGVSLAQFRAAAEQAISAVKKQGTDVILLAPPLSVAEPAEMSLGLTVPYAAELRAVAQEQGVFFADLGELSALIQVLPEADSPEKIFPGIVESYTHYYRWPADSSPTLPTAAMQEKLGRWLTLQLLGEPVVAMPWQLSAGHAELLGDGRLAVQLRVKNTSPTAQKITTLPLLLPAWEPEELAPMVELQAGQEQALTLHYKPRADSSAEALPSHSTSITLPWLLATGAAARVEAVSLPLLPAQLLWKTQSLFNQTDGFTLNAELTNAGQQPIIDAPWTAEWLGQKLSGKVSVAPGKRGDVVLKLAAPDLKQHRAVAELSWQVQLADRQLRFHRMVEVVRNIGLKDTLPLVGGPESQGQVILRADADEGNLFLTLDIRDISMEADPGGVALQGRLSLDARSYGMRQTAGAVEAITFTTAAADGPGRVGPIAPWAFGTGYGFLFDETAVRCQLSTRSQGRRVQITLPRSYLRLHEWAMGNGNSQLGLHLALSLWQPEADGQGGAFTPAGVWLSAVNARQADDATRLPQLELTASPTQRFTVITW